MGAAEFGCPDHFVQHHHRACLYCFFPARGSPIELFIQLWRRDLHVEGPSSDYGIRRLLWPIGTKFRRGRRAAALSRSMTPRRKAIQAKAPMWKRKLRKRTEVAGFQRRRLAARLNARQPVVQPLPALTSGLVAAVL